MKIGGVEIGRGERRIVELFGARLYTHAELKIPIQVVRGRRSGPRLFICAALHGDEINGVEVIHRLLQFKALDKLRGTLVAVPVVNVFGFIQQSRYLPDRRDLNRSFPGSPKGSLAARMARHFLREVVEGSDFGIDLHTGSNDRSNLPQLRVAPGDEVAQRMARFFGAPVILNNKPPRGTLRAAAARRGVPLLVYEGGQALRFEEEAIRPGVRGVAKVMRGLGMLPKARTVPPEPMVANRSRWIRAPMGGVLRIESQLGAQVWKGEIVGTISDPFGEAETRVLAPSDGLIIGRLERPLVHRGDAVIHLASSG